MKKIKHQTKLNLHKFNRICGLMEIFSKSVIVSGCEQNFSGTEEIGDEYEMTVPRGEMNELYRFLYEELIELETEILLDFKNGDALKED